jgi:hypothetical protein
MRDGMKMRWGVALVIMPGTDVMRSVSSEGSSSGGDGVGGGGGGRRHWIL